MAGWTRDARVMRARDAIAGRDVARIAPDAAPSASGRFRRPARHPSSSGTVLEARRGCVCGQDASRGPHNLTSGLVHLLERGTAQASLHTPD